MQILIITSLATVLTFLGDLVFRRAVESHPFYAGRFKIHHSVLGAALFGAGIIMGNRPLLSIGLGMYLAHGLEEMYFNHTRAPQSFFVFVTRRTRRLPSRRRTRTMNS